MKRYLFDTISTDLEKKMVFVGGPRQVGKTTLAKSLLDKKSGYLNYDFVSDRQQILSGPWPDSKLWVFDEIHKYNRWRNHIKGLYDKFAPDQKILVTGSARLDYYRRGGDSLQGRYFYYRLHPLSVAELKIKTQKDFIDLFKFGGFPEPFFEGTEKAVKRWTQAYISRLLADDITSLEMSQNLTQMELALWRLPDLVASPLSINSLREDIGTSHTTLAKWLDIFERLYAIYRIPPFGGPRIRAVKKEQKHYHFNWAEIQNEGARFENMIASHLLKWVHYKQDTEAENLELRFFRTRDNHEIDFIVTKDLKPIYAIEAKLGDEDVSKSLVYFKKKYPQVEALQISFKGKKDFISRDNIRVMPALSFLTTLK
jgi:predicted AAA+ superfamily ATPase